MFQNAFVITHSSDLTLKISTLSLRELTENWPWMLVPLRDILNCFSLFAFTVLTSRQANIQKFVRFADLFLTLNMWYIFFNLDTHTCGNALHTSSPRFTACCPLVNSIHFPHWEETRWWCWIKLILSHGSFSDISAHLKKRHFLSQPGTQSRTQLHPWHGAPAYLVSEQAFSISASARVFLRLRERIML